MTPEIADAMVQITLTRGGGTFDGNGASIEPSEGYAVGLNTKTFMTIGLDETDLAYGAFKAILDQWKSAYIGTWLHNGQIYIDPVMVFKNRSLAEKTGRHFKQIAIYDFATKKEIYL